ncbi:MAG: AMP-binding protein, partial [Pseudomonadota bacterium]
MNFLTAHAQANPNGIAFTFIEDDGAKHQISFSDLHRAAQSISTCLTGKVKSGEAVVLLFPQGLEYIQAFLGCLYAGIVAVPLYPPKSRNHAERVISAIKDCDAKLALSCDEYKPALDQDLTSLPVIGFAELSRNLPVTSMPEPTPKQLAFLQYTSGSTGSPKGVMVSHGNILANLKSLQEATKCSASDVFCNWLPLFHDLGLVNTVLLPIYLGSHSVLMSPARFVKRPMAWFEAISEYRASICGAPNFAFDHCINRTHDIQENSINLSSWRVAFNAAEPIDINTIQKFSQCFSGLGFKESAFYPSYGMAEATVFISGCASSMSVLQQSFNADSLKIGRVEIDQKSRNKQTLVACGMAQADHCIKIVEPELAVELSEDRVGEIWFSGPSVAQGYWNDIEKTKASFGARLPNDDREYLRTGDLGFMHHGQLFISGRMKDVLIIKGRNYYPQDIEGVAYHSSNGLNQGGAAAFEVHGRAVLVQEVDVRSQKQFDYAYACSNIQSAIYEHFEILLDDIVFVRARKISKTSSGKIQRALTKKQYMSGDINALYSLKAATIQYAQQPVAPTTALTALEERLCCLWQEVLGIECISIDDNFLMLGGHSLFATRLITKISQDLNCHISIKDLFQSLTIRNLAAIIETAAPSKTSSIVKALEAQKWELSFSQQRLWLLDQIEGGNSHYNMPGALKLSGALDLNTLHQVFSSILERHESLRTCFAVDENGQSLQVIQAAVSFHVPLVDLSE